jgi:predicted ATPase
MRIAISGSHGVGKTTLAEKLNATLKFNFISEVARKVAAEMGYATTDDIMAATQEEKRIFQQRVFYDQLLAEMTRSVDNQGFISDRSIFDVLAYMQLYQLPPDFIKQFLDYATRYSVSYDRIIYCPIPAGDIFSDGFRLTDKNTQIVVDYHLLQLLKLYAKCPVIYLGTNRDTWYDVALGDIVQAAA